MKINHITYNEDTNILTFNATFEFILFKNNENEVNTCTIESIAKAEKRFHYSLKKEVLDIVCFEDISPNVRFMLNSIQFSELYSALKKTALNYYS